jgi:hypothetical protein
MERLVWITSEQFRVTAIYVIYNEISADTMLRPINRRHVFEHLIVEAYLQSMRSNRSVEVIKWDILAVPCFQFMNIELTLIQKYEVGMPDQQKGWKF